MPPKKRKRYTLEIEEDVIYVAESTIPGAGKGMFARKKISAGKRLGRYIGDLITCEEAEKRQDKTYFMFSKKGYVVDGARLDNTMRWVNHSTDRQNAEANIYPNGSIIFETLRTVKPGEEIFIDYGYDPTEK